MADFTERFWARVDRGDPSSCWVWTRGRNNKGYGKLYPNGRNLSAHRVAWELSNGPIPEGRHVLHRCDNPPCCNPAHLFVGTNGDNVRDKVQKGRQPKGSSIHRARITEEQAREIVKRLREGHTQRAIAKDYGFHHGAVGAIARGETWIHVTGGHVEHRVEKGGEQNGSSKLTREQVQEIKRLLTEGKSRRFVKELFGVSKSCIQRIAVGESWK